MEMRGQSFNLLDIEHRIFAIGAAEPSVTTCRSNPIGSGAISGAATGLVLDVRYASLSQMPLPVDPLSRPR
jgi:hypothetical protein